jgi:UDPglucose--hexose-1-phosphate uridylyltransferase
VKNELLDTWPSYSESCPFCPANESKYSNVELDRINAPDGSWLVLGMENKYKAFEDHATCPSKPSEFDKEGIYNKFIGCGTHELVIESPTHNQTLATMSTEQITNVLKIYLRRFNAISRNPNNLLTIIFKNHGAASGASQQHPHSQIVALRVIPNYVRFLLEEAQRFFDSNGVCVFCKIIEHELELEKRIIYHNKHFVSMIPYASPVPYQTEIYPIEHHSIYGEDNDEKLRDFADCLRKTMKKLYLTLSNPDFNMIFRNPPYPFANTPSYHWHLQIVPHIFTPGGFEHGSRMSVNVLSPEEAAANLRQLEV